MGWKDRDGIGSSGACVKCGRPMLTQWFGYVCASCKKGK